MPAAATCPAIIFTRATFLRAAAEGLPPVDHYRSRCRQCGRMYALAVAHPGAKVLVRRWEREHVAVAHA